MSNIIDAIVHLVNHHNLDVLDNNQGNNRANNAGDGLEDYIKHLFAGTFDLPEGEKEEVWDTVFSYQGNSKNPPDAMLRGGDMIEVKKIENPNAELALNSSYPKHTVHSSDPMLAKECIDAEDWTEKDIIYTVGVIDERASRLMRLCMAYGLDYCASDKHYSQVKETIKDGIQEIQGVEFAETRELGRVNRVDPFGITYLRVRNMWGIENPWRVFDYTHTVPENSLFDFMCIINDQKWEEFENVSVLIELQRNNRCLNIQNVQIKNPDNPEQLRGAKLITYNIAEE